MISEKLTNPKLASQHTSLIMSFLETAPPRKAALHAQPLNMHSIIPRNMASFTNCLLCFATVLKLEMSSSCNETYFSSLTWLWHQRRCMASIKTSSFGVSHNSKNTTKLPTEFLPFLLHSGWYKNVRRNCKKGAIALIMYSSCII